MQANQIVKKKSTVIRGSLGDNVFDIVDNVLVALFLFIVIFPLYWVIIASFSNPELVNRGQVLLFPRDIGFSGYERVFAEPKIWRAYGNTVFYTVMGTSMNVIVTLMGGYALSRDDLPLRPVIMKLLIFTMFFNGGLIPTYLVVKALNLIDKVWAVLLPTTLQVYNLTVCRAFFQSSLPPGLSEAAMIDGASNMRTFFTIVLPVSPAIISVLILFHAVFRWNEYFNAMMYLKNSSLYPLQLILRDILLAAQAAATDMASNAKDQKELIEMQRLAQQIKYGSIIISTMPMMILYPFLQKYFVKGVMVGALKG